MPMEAAAVDELVEKGKFQADVAQAIAAAVDITMTAANLVTIPVLDARFAAYDAKMEARFGSVEKSIASLKSWVTYLYAGLSFAFFSALAVDHHWLVTREDQLIAQVQTRADQRLAQMDQRFMHIDQRFERIDQRFEHIDQRFEQIDRRFEQMQARTDQRFEQVQAREDAILDQLRALTARVGSIQAAMQPSPSRRAEPSP